jgi:hypothetical protein
VKSESHGVRLLFAPLILALLAGDAGAQQASPTPGPATGGTPSVGRPASERITVVVPGAASPPKSSSVSSGGLTGIRGLAFDKASARLALPGEGARLVRAGDVVGGDTVREIGDRRLVLDRRDATGRHATVVVDFDRNGNSVVRVFATTPRSEVQPVR